MRTLRRAIAGLAATTIAVAGLAMAVGAGSASAAGIPDTVCHGGSVSGTVAGNLIVPAGVKCQAFGVDVKGNVYVAGELQTFGGTLEHSLYVTGGAYQDINYGINIRGNVVIVGSAGSADGQNGFWDEYSNSTIGGSLYYLGNTTSLYSGDGQVTSAGRTYVLGKFVYGFNTVPNNQTAGSLFVLGGSTIF
jgi:hypothetical protein